MQAARGDKYSRGGESNQAISMEGIDLSAVTAASPEEIAKSQAEKEKKAVSAVESPTATGKTGDTAEHKVVVVIPGTTIPFPKEVSPNGRVMVLPLNHFLGSSSNRENPRGPVNGPANLLSDQAIFPLAVWATGVIPAPGTDSSEYFRKYTTGVLASTKSKMSDPQKSALRRSLMLLKEGESPEVISGVDTITQLIAKDPVGVFRELLNTVSDRQGAGAPILVQALTRFREIAARKK